MQIKNILFLATSVAAHFRLNYPQWRGDSLSLATQNTSISQWNWPCAGVGQETSRNNRTDWPVTGGTVKWNSSHEYAITYVNLGLGESVTSFNISLLRDYNGTGAGVQCFSRLGQQALSRYNFTDGQPASIQVITLSTNGASLYNCADITLRRNASILSGDDCRNGTGVGGYIISSSASSAGSNASTAAKTGAAARGVAVPVAALMTAMGAGAYALL